MPTIRDVASLAGVSTATVSHVVNNSRPVSNGTRKRVEAAVEQTGFTPHPAGRSLARHRASARPPLMTEGVNADRPPEISSSADLFAATCPPRLQVTSTSMRGLLKLIHAAQPISRAEIARRLGVNRSTVTEIVKPLLASQVLREVDVSYGVKAAAVGRPPVGLALDADRKFFVGINIGVRQSQVGAVTADDRMLAEQSFDTPADAAQALALIRISVATIRERLADRQSSPPERSRREAFV